MKNSLLSLLSLRRILSFFFFCSSCLFLPVADAQTVAAVTDGRVLEEMIPELQKTKTVDQVLGLMRPSVSKTQLIKSDYLLLDAPPIAKPGIVSIRMMSEIPGTEFFMLLNTAPAQDESAFLSLQKIPNLGKADVRTKVKLQKHTNLLLLAKAGGQWYSVESDVKITTK